MPSTTEPAALAHGRTAAAKPLATSTSTVLAPTASTRAKQAASTSSEKKPTRTPKESTAAATPKKPSSLNKRPEPNPVSAKPKSVQSSTASSVKKEPLKKPTPKTADPHDGITGATEADNGKPSVEQEDSSIEATEERVPVQPISQPQPQQAVQPTDLPPTSDPLQVAAQTYPWLYMNSTLEACFAGAEKTAHKELDECEKQLEEDEAQLADEKFRHDSERMIEFCDELESDTFSKDAPAIMQSFISHGEECTRIEAEALELVATTPSLDSEEPLRAYNVMLDNLDELQEQASKLESSILRLTESTSPSSNGKEAAGEEESVTQEADVNWARAQIIGVFAACLPVLRARITNLTMAQELVDSAQENLSLALRMESMGIE